MVMDGVMDGARLQRATNFSKYFSKNAPEHFLFYEF
ncbi:MAG: hypothetical protein JWR54_1418 [Mucilaginibacter sp.]|nr:hypothetical protein [Mucilaginibacter sp.]